MATAKKSAPKKKAAAKAVVPKPAVKKPAAKRTVPKPKVVAASSRSSRETALVVLFALLSIAFALLAFYQYGRA